MNLFSNLFKKKEKKHGLLIDQEEQNGLVDCEKRSVILPPKPQKPPKSPKGGGLLPRRDNALEDPDDDEPIPTIYCVTGFKGLLKEDRKWLEHCKIPDETIVLHFNTILTILNFLRRKDLVYYRFMDQPMDQMVFKDNQIPSVIVSSNQNNSKENSNNSPTLISQQLHNNTSATNSSSSSVDVEEEDDDHHSSSSKPNSNSTTNISSLLTNTDNTSGNSSSNQAQGIITTTTPTTPNTSSISHVIYSVYQAGSSQSGLKKKRIDSNKIFIAPGNYCKFPENLSLAVDKLLNEGNPKEHYKNLDFEAKGGFGSVFAAKNKNIHSNYDKLIVALKKMPHKTLKQKRMNLNEIGFLKYCNHPNIVKFLCSYQKNDELWLIMEFMEGGTLREATSNFVFSEEKIAFVAREILQGIEYLHKNGLCHRDLKSSNIMISTKGEIKIIDFGLAIDFSEEKEDIHMCGSPFWMPPEQIHGKPHSFSVDIWSFGVCIAEMMDKKVPNHKSRLKAMIVIATEGLVFTKEKYPEWSDEALDFLDKCLQVDPTKRSSASDLLLHPFLLKACNISEIKEILPALFMSHTLARQGLF